VHTFLGITLSNAVVATVLALVAAVIGRLCRRPALRHGLWLLVLLKLVTPPLVPVSLSWLGALEVPALASDPSPEQEGPPPPSQPQQSGEFNARVQGALTQAREPDPAAAEWILVPVESPAENTETAPSQTITLAALVSACLRSSLWEAALPLWLGVAFVWLTWTAAQAYRFQRLLRYARKAPASLQGQAQALADRMGLRTCPGIWLVPGAVSPMLWVVGRTPRLLFPSKLLNQLDAVQRATLLVHELAHYRRRDHWGRILEMVVFALYWWHPVAWWARHELHEAEEQCCDAWVVWTLADAERAYATALLQTVAFVSQARCPLPAMASGVGQVRHLRRRLIMIMQGKTPRSQSWAGFLAVLGLGLLLLPVQAQTADEKSDREQTIEKLKKTLKKLEDEERAEKGAGAKKASAADLDKAKAELADASKELEARRHDFEIAQRRHLKALSRLAEMEGKPVSRIVFGPDGKSYSYMLDNKEDRIMIVTPDDLKKHNLQFHIERLPGDAASKPLHVETADGKIFMSAPAGNNDHIYRYEVIKPGSGSKEAHGAFLLNPKKKAETMEKEKIRTWVRDKEENEGRSDKANPDNKVYEYRIIESDKAEKPRVKRAPSADDKTGDLEKRLERLLKEVEELKDELKKSRSGVSTSKLPVESRTVR
jgi:bla regulator protein blaR1